MLVIDVFREDASLLLLRSALDFEARRQTCTEPSTAAETRVEPLPLTTSDEMIVSCAFGISQTSSLPTSSCSFQKKIRPLVVPPTAYSPSLSKHLRVQTQSRSKVSLISAYNWFV